MVVIPRTSFRLQNSIWAPDMSGDQELNIGLWAVLRVSEQVSSGTHNRTWDGRSDDGRTMPAGVYLARLDTGDERRSMKMVLLSE